MQTGVRAFEDSLMKTKEWLKEVQEELGLRDENQAYSVTRGVLHALRDRLPVDEAVEFGSQLPMVLRGVYYDGWDPSGKPLKIRTQAEFLGSIRGETHQDLDWMKITRGVFKIVEKHVSHGEVQDVKDSLPASIRKLWSH